MLDSRFRGNDIIYFHGKDSGYVPAFAGMTSSIFAGMTRRDYAVYIQN